MIFPSHGEIESVWTCEQRPAASLNNAPTRKEIDQVLHFSPTFLNYEDRKLRTALSDALRIGLMHNRYFGYGLLRADAVILAKGSHWDNASGREKARPKVDQLLPDATRR